MRCEELEAHLMECLEEGRDPASTAEAGVHLDSCETCRRDAAELAALWERLPSADPARAAAEAPSSRMKERFDESLRTVLEARDLPGRSADREAIGGRIITGPWGRAMVTALAAALAIGVGLGIFFGGRLSTNAEVRELRAEVRSVNQVVAVALMTHDSASERLRGIALSSRNLSESTGGGGRVIEALLERVRNDPNDNVRLAAVEALGYVMDLPEVRDGLLACIGAQDSPQVQAVVLETLAQADPDAVDEALSSGQLNDEVRQWFQVVAPPILG